MIDDYVLAIAAAVIVASAIVLVSALAQYRRLVQEAEMSRRLAKDVWDSVNSRFSVIDARLIDLMARTEVLSSRVGLPRDVHPVPQSGVPGPVGAPPKSDHEETVAGQPSAGEGTETEARVLRFLLDGPKSSAQIKQEVGRSREHTARLMKALYDRGLVVRNDRNKPYVYEITEKGRAYFTS